MEAHVRTPDPLKNGKMDVNWRKWKDDFIIFMKASGFIKKPNDEKAYLLLNLIGDIGREAYQKFTFENPSDKENMDVLLDKFDEEFDPPKQETGERYIFFTRSKKNNESIEAYIDELQELAKTCNFGDLKESLVRDRIILDTKDKILRKKYLDTKNLTLEKMVQIHNEYESNTEKMKEISSTSNQANNMAKNDQKDFVKKCWRCDRNHPPRSCPAWGKTCAKCNEKNHFTQCCKNYLKKYSEGDNLKEKNENKNINQVLDKSGNKPAHPFEQVSKQNKKPGKIMNNSDQWVHVEEDVTRKTFQPQTQPRYYSSNAHPPSTAYVSNATAPVKKPVVVVAGSSHNSTYSGGSNMHFQNSKPQYPANQYRGHSNASNRNKQREQDSDCVLS